MQKHENQDKKLLDLPCNFIKSIGLIDSKKIKKVHNFFRKQYIALSYHKDFENHKYRQKWVENLFYLDIITTDLKTYSSDEIDQAFQIAFKVLDKNRQSVLQGKEVSND